MWKPLFIIYFGQLQYLQAVPSVKLCSSPVKAQNCILECSDTTITATVKFEHPSNKLQGSCIVPGNNALCDSANYTIHQNLPITYLNITSLDRNRDEGEWRCVHGLLGSPGQILYVPSPLVTQTTPQVMIAGSSLTVTCEMPCQYPTSAVTVEIIYAEEGSTNYGPFSSAPTVVTDFTVNTGCDSYESNYKAEFTLNKSNISSSLFNKKLTFKCNFTHSMIQESTGDTGPASALVEIKFQDLETTTQSKGPGNGDGLSGGTIAGIVIAVIVIVCGIAVCGFCIVIFIKKDKGKNDSKNKKPKGRKSSTVGPIDTPEKKNGKWVEPNSWSVDAAQTGGRANSVTSRKNVVVDVQETKTNQGDNSEKSDTPRKLPPLPSKDSVTNDQEEKPKNKKKKRKKKKAKQEQNQQQEEGKDNTAFENDQTENIPSDDTGYINKNHT